MVLTRRGKIMTLILVLVAAAGVLIVLAMMGKGPVKEIVDKVEDLAKPEAVCPLTGETAPGGVVPDRPALAVKVENDPITRPQYGLNTADVIYEETVEGGVTRFIVIYHCGDSERIEPIRSARTTDPPVLVQMGTAAFAYADAARWVIKDVDQYNRQIDDVNMSSAKSAYERDPTREVPHNLVSNTNDLWKAAKKAYLAVPEPLFTYGEMTGKSKKAKQVDLYFSSFSDVVWKWNAGQEVWLRYHGSTPHRYAEGGNVEAKNVVIQVVQMVNTDHLDPSGSPVPEAVMVGGGKAYLMRDGRVYAGKWERGSVEEDTVFRTAGGEEFVLTPGKTWVELFPRSQGKPKF